MSIDKEITVVLHGELGPITMSTIDDRPLDPEWERVEDLVFWLWSTRMQLERLAHAALDALPFGTRTRRRRSEQALTSSFEQHAFLLAARNLGRANSRAGKLALRDCPSSGTLRALQLLRDVQEHWDNNREAFRSKGNTEAKKAAAKLKAEFPDAKPWTLQVDPGNADVVVANIVSLAKLEKELRRAEAHARWAKRELCRKGKNQPLKD